MVESLCAIRTDPSELGLSWSFGPLQRAEGIDVGHSRENQGMYNMVMHEMNSQRDPLQ